MRYVTLGEVVTLHRLIIESTGGATGVRDLQQATVGSVVGAAHPTT